MLGLGTEADEEKSFEMFLTRAFGADAIVLDEEGKPLSLVKPNDSVIFFNFFIFSLFSSIFIFSF